MSAATLSSVIVLISILNVSQCQIYYQPVQILIPTNGTHYITRNNSTYNNTNVGPSVNNGYNNGHQYNRNYTNGFRNNSFYNGSQDGHLIVGSIRPYDRLLFSQTYFKQSRWWTYREKIIEYPKDLPAGYLRHETIYAIRVLNQFYDGNSARATIKSGGIGQQYVKIRIASSYSKGFRYDVKIYGH